jgi:glycosyltransferase involved in cell wall biosynthesis
MPQLSVVIPAYNEEAGIEEIVGRVLAVKEKLAAVSIDSLELLVVDDGSTDRTAELAGAIPGVTLIQHATNRGYGAALKTGFYQATGELVGFMDADGTYPPEYFPALCEQALDGYELVIGSRMVGAESQMPLTRRIGNLFFAGLLSLVGRQQVSDSASGMRVFRREILDRIYPLPDGLNLTPIMSTRAIHEGIRMTEVPIPYSERLGRSKLSVFRDGSLFLQSILWTVMSYNPVRILGMLGLGGIGVAVAVGIGLLTARLSGVTNLGPWGVAAAFAALVGGVAGISFFALGTTFNYLVSLFYKRPVRQGLFGRPIFAVPLDHHFGWMGLLALVAGIAISTFSLYLGVRGWEISRIWLYLLGSALMILVGIQLTIYWVLVRVLAELSQREILAQNDLQAA